MQLRRIADFNKTGTANSFRSPLILVRQNDAVVVSHSSVVLRGSVRICVAPQLECFHREFSHARLSSHRRVHCLHSLFSLLASDRSHRGDTLTDSAAHWFGHNWSSAGDEYRTQYVVPSKYFDADRYDVLAYTRLSYILSRDRSLRLARLQCIKSSRVVNVASRRG